tara:strand:+ start:75 stop:596 length:522 start_codon:yes stop_codon:yes gene_type:complete
MAHFAELDENNKVVRVIVVGNDCVPSDMHVDGETWCINFFKGGNWKQTSYNNNFRKSYAGIGMIYDPVKDKFLAPQPFASWTLDSNDDWQSPVAIPTITTYEDGTYTQEEVDADVFPEGHEKEGQKVNSFVVGDTKNSLYITSWDEENLRWVATDFLKNNFNWDASALAWVSA